MRQSGPRKFSESISPPAKRHTPSEQTDEAPGSVENEQVDVERDVPLQENESVERTESDERQGPPAFED